MIERISDLWQEYTVGFICAILALGIVAYLVVDHQAGGGTTSASVSDSQQQPSSQSTADAFPSPGTTITQTRNVRQKDGRIVTETVRAYTTIQANGKPQFITQTVRETAPGVRVTSIQKSTSTAVVTAPGRDSTITTVATESVTAPGPTVTAPGSQTTVTATATVTETVPGPTVTVTETVPGPTVTETVPAP